jgi:hypothetical protein
MTTRCPVPSQVEPDAMADLIADAALIALPRQATLTVAAEPQPAGSVVIPPASVSLVDSYADYGV